MSRRQTSQRQPTTYQPNQIEATMEWLATAWFMTVATPFVLFNLMWGFGTPPRREPAKVPQPAKGPLETPDVYVDEADRFVRSLPNPNDKPADPV